MAAVPVRPGFTWERAPWSRCARCGENRFGFLSGGDHSIVWRCSNCRYRVDEPLPEVKKKVIYIDQFVFSELFKLKAGTRREDKLTPFWREVDALLHRVVHLQQAVLPHSNIHQAETIVSAWPRELREAYEAMGGDMRFEDTNNPDAGDHRVRGRLCAVRRCHVHRQGMCVASDPRATRTGTEFSRAHLFADQSRSISRISSSVRSRSHRQGAALCPNHLRPRCSLADGTPASREPRRRRSNRQAPTAGFTVSAPRSIDPDARPRVRPARRGQRSGRGRGLSWAPAVNVHSRRQQSPS